MKKYITILMLLFYSKHILAQETIMLFSPLAQLGNSMTNDSMTFSKYYLSKYPQPKNTEQLLEEFENAQKYYLVKSYSLARQYYEKVIAMSEIDEWSSTQRQIIFLSYVRLSELNPNRSEELLRKGISFASELNPNKFKLSKQTQKDIEKVKEGLQKEQITWDTTAFRDDFHILLMNGHTIDLRKTKFIKIPSGKFRITFLSNTYKPQTFIASSQQIPLITPIRIPFVSGDCKKPIVNNEGELPSQLTVVYPEQCLRTFVDNKWNKSHKDTFLSNPINSSAITTAIETARQEPIYKKKWFWIAAGAIATVLVISSQSKDTKKPTHENVSGL